MERIRDRIFFGLGTDEPLFEEILLDAEALATFGKLPISVSWRKPLRIDEISKMAQTPEVKARPGRP
jgi:hypothetical protein